MIRFSWLLTVLCAGGAVSCDGSRKNGTMGTIPPGSTVSLGGATISVVPIATEKDRRHALTRLGPVTEERGHLLAWPRDRFIKLESQHAQASFDVAFLDRAGSVVDLQTLKQGDREGIMSKAEAAYALLAMPGLVQKRGVKTGDKAVLAAGILELKPQDLPIMKIGGVPAHIELALTESERQHGLMFRPRMSAEDGMLFAYSYEGQRSFWMANTLIPLDIAFFLADGTLVNVRETPMYPNPRHPPNQYPTADSAGPAQLVLEMNLGWFRKMGLIDASGNVKPGTKAEFPPEVKGE